MSTAAIPRLSPTLIEGAALLERGLESVRAVNGKEQNRFTRAFDALNRLAVAAQAPLAIVGGLAAIRYGYPAITEDIDVVAPRDALDSLLQQAPQYGFRVKWRSPKGWHTLTFEEVEINIVPEGGRARDTSPTTIPGPLTLGVSSGLEYAALPGWIELKLMSGRTKVRTHVVEVLKVLDASTIAEVAAHVRQVHPSYGELFEQLRVEADDERRQEAERGKE